MKKRVGLLLIAITICFFSLGCNKTATIDNHIFETGLKMIVDIRGSRFEWITNT